MYNTDVYVNGAYLVAKEDMTVRAAAKQVGVSKSALHLFLTKFLKDENFILADEVKEKLAQHLATRHLRGGEATKARYQGVNRKTIKEACNGR